MLHELLLALLGKTGSIFKQYPNAFAVDPAATILTPPEAQMLNSIVQCGYYYLQLIRFVEQENTEISFADPRKNPSVYRKAMAQGLRVALREYETMVLGIERDFLANRHFTFSSIRAETSKYQLIMEELHNLIQKILA
jgi:gamma-tubulin complex component 4